MCHDLRTEGDRITEKKRTQHTRQQQQQPYQRLLRCKPGVTVSFLFIFDGQFLFLRFALLDTGWWVELLVFGQGVCSFWVTTYGPVSLTLHFRTSHACARTHSHTPPPPPLRPGLSPTRISLARSAKPPVTPILGDSFSMRPF